jgi:glycosyltransferase involved in cell wall biosynthesis
VAKRALRLSGRTVLSTFGLLSSGKGIEYMIQAMPGVVEKHPDALYLVIGKTHPEVQRAEGERYRNALLELVHELGLHRSVQFVNHYLTQNQLVRYLQATDIYVTPYIGREQITSGTLAYALGCGRAAVSTPYLYAEEALAECRGLLAEFKDPDSLTRCVSMLLDDPGLRRRLQQNALEYGQHMSWPVVGARYADLFREVTAGEEGARPMAAHATYSAVAAGVPRLESLNGAVDPAEEPAAGLVGSARNG